MSKFTINLDIDYKIPDILHNISTKEWEVIFQYVSELLTMHDLQNAKLTKKHMISGVKASYENTIKDQADKLQEKQPTPTTTQTATPTTMLVEHFKNYTKDIKEIKDHLEKSAISKRRELKQIDKQLEYYNRQYDILQADQFIDEKQDGKLDDEKHPISKEAVIKIYIDLAIKNKTITQADLCLAINCSTSTLNKLGGYKLIVAEARNQYRNQYITPDIISRLQKYKVEHQRYPTRSEFIHSYVGDSTLRKLSKVLKESKILEYIYGLVEKEGR